MYPVTYSILSPAALQSDLLSEYDIGVVASCQLLHMGLNDTYLVQTATDRYVLRAYAAGWRTEDEIRFELDALNYLKHGGALVSAPIASRHGTQLYELEAPEGNRYAALFTYASGEGDDHQEETASRFGAAAARIHNASEGFRSEHHRDVLGPEHLIDASLSSILPFLSHRPDDQADLRRLSERLRAAVLALASEKLDHGFCHGDIHGGNAHVALNGSVTFFDFDCCGLGWRAYDIAVYRWITLMGGGTDVRWPAFLRGYQQNRALSELDLRATLLFVAVRHVWYLGLNTMCAQGRGVSFLTNSFWDIALKFLRERGEECIAESLLDV